MMSTKISGLAVDTDYTFHLVLRTSAGTFQSPKLQVRTHKMTDLTGITITPGIMPQALRDSLHTTVEHIGARIIDGVRIDTTHFVTTEGRGRDWEKAVEMNVPVVVPDWVKGCEREGRIVGVRGYYLNADPRLRQIGQPAQQQQSQQPVRSPPPQEVEAPRPRTPLQSPTTHITPPTPDQAVSMEGAAAAAAQEAEERRAAAASEVKEEEPEPVHEPLAEPQTTVEDAVSDDDDETPNGEHSDGEDEYAEQRQMAAEALKKSRGRAADIAQANEGREESGDFDEVQL